MDHVDHEPSYRKSKHPFRVPNDEVSSTIFRQLIAFIEHQRPKREEVDRRDKNGHEKLYRPILQSATDEDPRVPQQREAQVLDDGEEHFWRLVKQKASNAVHRDEQKHISHSQEVDE